MRMLFVVPLLGFMSFSLAAFVPQSVDMSRLGMVYGHLDAAAPVEKVDANRRVATPDRERAPERRFLLRGPRARAVRADAVPRGWRVAPAVLDERGPYAHRRRRCGNDHLRGRMESDAAGRRGEREPGAGCASEKAAVCTARDGLGGAYPIGTGDEGTKEKVEPPGKGVGERRKGMVPHFRFPQTCSPELSTLSLVPYSRVPRNGTGAGNCSANLHGAAPSRVSGTFASRARTMATGIVPPV